MTSARFSILTVTYIATLSDAYTTVALSIEDASIVSAMREAMRRAQADYHIQPDTCRVRVRIIRQPIDPRQIASWK
jgi:hypothetical protein